MWVRICRRKSPEDFVESVGTLMINGNRSFKTDRKKYGTQDVVPNYSQR